MTPRPSRVSKRLPKVFKFINMHKDAKIQRQTRVNKTAESLKVHLYTHKGAKIQRPPWVRPPWVSHQEVQRIDIHTRIQ